ncbi:hypothetical protein FQZ97_661320 [compost metagenome]
MGGALIAPRQLGMRQRSEPSLRSAAVRANVIQFSFEDAAHDILERRHKPGTRSIGRKQDRKAHRYCGFERSHLEVEIALLLKRCKRIDHAHAQTRSNQ